MNDKNFVIWKNYYVLGPVLVQFLECLIVALFESILQQFQGRIWHSIWVQPKEPRNNIKDSWEGFQNRVIYSEAIAFQKVKETSAFSNRKRVDETWKSCLEHSARKIGTAYWMSWMNNLFWITFLETYVPEMGIWNDCFLLVIVEGGLSSQRNYHILVF